MPSRSQTGGEIIDSQRSEAGKKISVIVPVYNEEDNVGPLFEALFPILSKLTPDFETIAVNDGSTDRSCARLIALAKQHPEVKVVNFRRNFGQPFSNSISPADWRMQICESAREFIEFGSKRRLPVRH